MSQLKYWPKISIVTPSLNQGQYLEATIRSVLNQGYPNLEYFVMDGGSTDQSQDIIRRYSSQLTCWKSRSDKGQAAAINAGFSRATGDLIGWVNSDDRLLEHSLFALAKAHRYDKDAILFGDGIIVDELRGSEMKFTARNIAYESFAEASLRYGLRWCQPGTFMPRAVYAEIGGLDESLRYVFDLDWICRALAVAPVHSIRQPIAIIRLHPTSKTVGESACWHDERVRMAKKYWPSTLTASQRAFSASCLLLRADASLQTFSMHRRSALREIFRAVRISPPVVRRIRFWILLLRAFIPVSILQSVRRVWWRVR